MLALAIGAAGVGGAAKAASRPPRPMPPELPPPIETTPLMALAQPSAERLVAVGLRGAVLAAPIKPAAAPPAPAPMPPMPVPMRGPALPAFNPPAMPPTLGWQAMQSPVRATLTALRFHGAGRGYAAGHQGHVLRSDDDGQRWHIVASGAGGVDPHPAMPWFDLALGGADDITVVGAYGRAMRSTDGGASWRLLRIAARGEPHLYAVVAQHDKRVVVGEQGFMAGSEDGGQTWRTLPTPAPATWFGALLSTSGALTVFGLQGRAFHRADDNAPFAAIELPTPSTLTAACALDTGHLLFTSQVGQLFSWLPGTPRAALLRWTAPFPLVAVQAAPKGDGFQLWVAGLRGALSFQLPRNELRA